MIDLIPLGAEYDRRRRACRRGRVGDNEPKPISQQDGAGHHHQHDECDGESKPARPAPPESWPPRRKTHAFIIPPASSERQPIVSTRHEQTATNRGRHVRASEAS
jgi:hypothetical protein